MLGEIFGIGANLAATSINNESAREREEEARKQNFYYNELAANNSTNRTIDLYNKLYSPGAKMQQLKNAGLSPSLFYEGAGVGGGTQAGAQGAGAGGINPNVFGIDPLAGAQIGLIKAQTENVEEDTHGKKIDNERKDELNLAKIAEAWANVGAQGAAEELNRANADLAKFNKTLGEATQEHYIAEACHRARKAYFDAENANVEWNFANDSYNDRLTQIAENIKKTKSEAQVNEAQKDLDKKMWEFYDEQIRYLSSMASAKSKDADSYANFVNGYVNNLPEVLKVRREELNVEKWSIGVNAFTELVRTVGYLAGATQLGEGSTETHDEEEIETFDKKGKKTGSQKRVQNKRINKKPAIPLRR